MLSKQRSVRGRADGEASLTDQGAAPPQAVSRQPLRRGAGRLRPAAAEPRSISAQQGGVLHLPRDGLHRHPGSSGTPTRPSDPLSALDLQKQPLAGLFHEVQDPVETRVASIIGIGNLPFAAVRGKFHE